MKAEEVYGALRAYINASLKGVGALKGAPCQISSIVDGDDDHTITFSWVDDNGDEHTSTLIVKDGAPGATGSTGPQGPTGPAGADGSDGSDGFSPTITVKQSDTSTYILTITTADTSYDTPNLKGSGGGGATVLSDLTDVDLTSLAAGDVLIYDNDNSKWVNSTALKNKIDTISVNGQSQTVSSGAVDLDVASNLITEDQWSTIETILS